MNFAFDDNIDLHFLLISTAYSLFYIIEKNDEIDDVSDTNDATIVSQKRQAIKKKVIMVNLWKKIQLE